MSQKKTKQYARVVKRHVNKNKHLILENFISQLYKYRLRDRIKIALKIIKGKKQKIKEVKA